MPEPGWLSRQFVAIKQDAKTWPDWMRGGTVSNDSISVPTRNHRMTLAERFRRLIDAKGLSIAGLADTAGMERQQVHRVVTGKVLNPGILTVQRIVEAAGATMGEFFADED